MVLQASSFLVIYLTELARNASVPFGVGVVPKDVEYQWLHHPSGF